MHCSCPSGTRGGTAAAPWHLLLRLACSRRPPGALITVPQRAKMQLKFKTVQGKQFELGFEDGTKVRAPWGAWAARSP